MAGCILDLRDEFPDIRVVGQVARSGSADWQAGIPRFPTLSAAGERLDGGIDLVIDFTLPEGTRAAARWCGAHGVPLLSGVTGIDGETEQALDHASRGVPVLWAANLSPGINLVAGMLADLGRVIGEDASVTIEETHHAGKKDAPSGTALLLARALRPPRAGGGTDPGRIGEDFPSVEFVSHRQGQVVGDHSVTLVLPGETLTLSHHAEDRHLFARGALDAARWLVKQPPGRYSAADWIRGAAGH